jgi:hypothetical protein
VKTEKSSIKLHIKYYGYNILFASNNILIINKKENE